MPSSPTASASEGGGELPMALLALAAWGAMWLASSGWLWAVVAGVVIVAVGLARAWRRRRWMTAGMCLLMLGSLLAGGWRVAALQGDPVRDLAVEGAMVRLQAVLQSSDVTPAHGVLPQSWWGTARVVAVDGRGRSYAGGGIIEVVASGAVSDAWASLHVGAVFEASVRLSAPETESGVLAAAKAREPPSNVRGPQGWQAAIESARAGLRQAAGGLPGDQRALVPAIVIGDTSGVTTELSDCFRVTGLTHLMAVSGENLTLLLAFVSVAAVAVGITAWRLRLLLALTVGVFVALCRAEPSVLRAAAMGCVGLVALGWGRNRGAALRYLATAVIVLVCFDPWLSRSPGFALSVAASFGLIRWSGLWADLLGRWLPRSLAEAVAVPLAAQVATQPILTLLSGQLSVVGLASNALAAPLVGPATVLGFAALGVGVVLPVAAPALAWCSGWFVQGIVWIARLGTGLPGSAVVLGTGVIPVVVSVLVSAVLVFLLPRLLGSRVLVGVCVVVMAAFVVRPWAPAGWPPPDWRVVVCDVGQGDATVVRAGEGVAVVIDTGPEPKGVDRCLTRLGIRRVALLVLTHGHADHIGGLTGVGAGGRPVDEVLLPVTSRTARGLSVANVAHVEVAQPGESLTIGEAVLLVVAAGTSVALPPSQGEGESSAENDASTVGVVSSGGVRLLFAGDLETEAQQALATQEHAADVLLVPHHGSSRQDESFLTAVHACAALVSVGVDNDYGHPTAKTLALLGRLGLPVARTDHNGGIAIVVRDGRIQLVTER